MSCFIRIGLHTPFAETHPWMWLASQHNPSSDVRVLAYEYQSFLDYQGLVTPDKAFVRMVFEHFFRYGTRSEIKARPARLTEATKPVAEMRQLEPRYEGDVRWPVFNHWMQVDSYKSVCSVALNLNQMRHPTTIWRIVPHPDSDQEFL